MRLRYDQSTPGSPAPLVLLGPNGQRVEMHIRSETDRTSALIALSGNLGNLPEKDHQQGPFQSIAHAIGARRAIAAELLDLGFRLSDEHALWTLAAQRLVKQMRETKAASRADYRFHPRDVYLDW